MKQEEFWEHIDKSNDCWLWTRGGNGQGYGQVWIDGRGALLAHRLAYELANQEQLTSKSCIIQICKNRRCVRPEHLKAITPKERTALIREEGNAWWQKSLENVPRGDRNGARTKPERRARGELHGRYTQPDRSARGERHGSQTHPEQVPRAEEHPGAKLTWEQVREIRRRHANEGAIQKQLAAEYGVTQANIWGIVHNKTWKEGETTGNE